VAEARCPLLRFDINHLRLHRRRRIGAGATNERGGIRTPISNFLSH
jgi:hypothetical protein